MNKRLWIIAVLVVIAAALITVVSVRSSRRNNENSDVNAEQAQETQETGDTVSENTDSGSTEQKEPEEEKDEAAQSAAETEEEETEPEDLRSLVLEAYSKPFIVTANLLNVRLEPNTSAPVVATIVKNGAGEVLGTTEGGDWTRISSGGVEGYVASEFVVTGEEAEKLAEENCTEGIRITKDAVNVRAKADADAGVLLSAEAGEVYQTLGTENEFYHVSVGGQDGFVHISCAEPVYFLAEAVSTGYSPEESSIAEQDQTQEQETSEEAGSVAETATPAAPPETPQAPGGAPPASYTGGSNGIIVCIDPGHQAHGIPDLEPNGPGSSVMKAKLTTGTQGCVTGIPEYEINLQVSLRLQAELQARGYTVVMIRTTNNCPSSNAERAMTANNAGANIFVRIHCNSSTNAGITGVINYAPSGGNPYLSQPVINGSNNLAALLAAHMCAVTGAVNRGVLQDDTMTGINWCQMPVTIVEMGFMSNPTEDQLLANADYQYKLAVGMANGIDAYFGR